MDMEKILGKIEQCITEITEPERIERILEIAARLMEAYLRIRAL